MENKHSEKKCPKCGAVMGSYNIGNAECFSCESCGFDSCEEEMEYESGKKSSQKAKGSYSPYKHGGSRRAK